MTTPKPDLADRTPASSPFFVLYEKRTSTSLKRPSRAKPLAETLRARATRVNPYSELGMNNIQSTDRADQIKRGGI